jgi:imidazolonepropionase-like amidohydrolase
MRMIPSVIVGTMLLALPAAASAQTSALVGARVIDGAGGVIDRGTVIVRDGRIVAVGPAASTQVPAGATRIDLAGKTVMPGLINAHGHVGNTVGLRTDPMGHSRENLVRQLRTYAQYGVTTVYSLGDDQEAGFALRDEQAQRPVDRARLYVAGAVINGTSAEEVRAITDKVADQKPDILKIRVDDNLGTGKKMPEAAWKAAISRAHERGLRMAVHIFYLADAKATLAAGADFIGHSVRDVPIDAAFASSLKARDVCYCPTFTREVSTFVYDSTPPWASDPFFLKGVDADIAKQLADPGRHAQIRSSPGYKLGLQYKAGLEVAKKNLKALVDQGVRVAMGTDTGPPARFQGFFEHLEMEMMVEAGMTPMQVIVSATGDAARCHKKDAELGLIAPGRQADLLILGANPLENIRNLRAIEQVWVGGRRLGN